MLRARRRTGHREPLGVGLPAGAHQLGPLLGAERAGVQQAQHQRAAQAVGAPRGRHPRPERPLALGREHVLLRGPRPLLPPFEQPGGSERRQLAVDLAAGDREEGAEPLRSGGHELPARHRALVQ